MCWFYFLITLDFATNLFEVIPAGVVIRSIVAAILLAVAATALTAAHLITMLHAHDGAEAARQVEQPGRRGQVVAAVGYVYHKHGRQHRQRREHHGHDDVYHCIIMT